MNARLQITLTVQFALVLLACDGSARRKPADDAGTTKSERNGSAASTASPPADGDAASPAGRIATTVGGAAAHGGAPSQLDSGSSSASITSDAGPTDASAPLDSGRADSAPMDDTGSSDAAEDAGSTKLSCVQEPVGNSSCTYSVSSGAAVVTSLAPADAARENSCPNDPVKVSFVWQPDDPESARCAADARLGMERSSWTFQIGDGKHPPRSCIDAASIDVGSRLTVLRKDIVSGACTPVLFDFGPLAQRCSDTCFP